MDWSEWKRLSPSIIFTAADLKETLDGGQAFRWRNDDGLWQGIWGPHLAQVRLEPNGRLSGRALKKHSEQTIVALESYLGADTDWNHRRDCLPHRNDSHLHGCIQNFATLRLLSQPFGETLLAFLCSATKQIPQIKVMCENLANTLGSEIISGIHALPSWIQVASASEENLRSLSLGFRAKNIKRTADVIAKNPNLLFQIENAPYPEAKEQLMALPGVGSKIADCALLFGAGKLEAFPVDTWIIKAMEKRYNLNGWKPQQIEHFGRVHFGPLAGYAQQFLFSWERINR